MHKHFQRFLYACLLLIAGTLKADDCCNDTTSCCDCSCSSVFVLRSVGDDLRRQAIYRNFRPDAQVSEDCCFGNGVFGIDYRFQRSRHGDNIARSLFGSNVLLFQGSNVADRNPLALMADNFGLASDTNQQIGFCPRFTNNIIDFELYFELNNLCNGLFVQLNAPVCRTKFRINAFDGSGMTLATNSCNNNCNNGCNNDCNDCGQSLLPPASTTSFCPGYVGPVLTVVSTGEVLNPLPPLTSFEAALVSFGLGCNRTETKLASFNMILGYNAWVCDDYNVGIFLRAAAPTGTNYTCCDLRAEFAPEVGDNHWKLGGGLTGRYDLYNCDDDHFVTIYAEGYAEHMFDHCQSRTFDFRDKGCLSRYMLLKEFVGTTPTGSILPGLAFTTRSIKTSVSVQGEGQIEIGYRNNCGFSAGLGWNIYGKSGESACALGNPCDPAVIGKNYGFKGCTQVQNLCIAVGSDGGGSTAFVNDPAVFTTSPNNSTASASDIHTCGAIDNPVFSTTATTFPAGPSIICVDACSPGFTTPVAGQAVVLPDPANGTVTINGVVVDFSVASTPPVFISADDIDINSGLARSQLTNKIFGHIDYEWENCDYVPKVYFGGEVEFASESRCAGMSAWAVFLGGSIDF